MGVSLVLGGGGARGLAHIGVYKAMSELGIEISEVVGTSAGAIVGAAIALGKSPDEVLQFRHDTKLRKMADIRMGTLSVRDGMVYGEKLLEHLDHMYDSMTFDDTRIPCRILVTDAHTGDAKVMETGSLAAAVRASSSLPGVMASYRDDTGEYIDGCFCANLPLGFAHGDDIIACSVQGPYDQFTKGTGTIHQMKSLMAMMLRQQELRDIYMYSKDKNVQLIYPDVHDIGTLDFSRSDRIIQHGYEKAMEMLG